MIDSPFLVQLIHAFQDDRYLYFVMPLFAGGDLSLYLKHYGIMNEAMLRYYIAEIVLAIECLHSCNIVYRDLKPQNVLMRPDGHICLTDFGLCKLNPPKGNGISDLKGRIGTKGYQAPEIVRGLGHSFPVDFFALGVTIYRLATDSRLFAKNKTTFPYPIPVPTKHMVLIPTLDPALVRATFTGDEGQQWHNAQNAYGAYTHKTAAPVTAARESQRNQIAKQQVKSAGEQSIELPPALADLIQQLVDVDPSYRLGTKNRAMRSGAPATPSQKAAPSPRFSPMQTEDPSIAEVYSQYGGTSDMSVSNASVTGRVRAGTVMSTNKQVTASRRMTSSQPQPVAAIAPRQEEDPADEGNFSDSDNAPRNASPSLSARKKPHPAASPRFGARRTPSVQSSGSRGKYKMTLFRGRDELGNWNALHSGFQQIKHHPFFDGFDWDAMADLRLAPPFVPVVNISAVQQVFKADPNERNQANTKTRLSPEEQTLFHGFELNHVIRRNTDSAASSSTTTSASVPTQSRPKRRH
jgi:serine/threonine protein kinase